MPSSFRKRVKSSLFQQCLEIISPMISVGDFESAFEQMKEYHIGPDTLNNRNENFLWRFIDALNDHDMFGNRSSYIRPFPTARHNFLTMIKAFVKQGVDLNHQDNLGFTVLIFAAHGSTLDFCNLLLQFDGVDIDLTDTMGFSALDVVITRFYGQRFTPALNKRLPELNSELVRLLLLNGADPYRPYFNETTAPPTEYTKLDPYAWLKKDDCFFYKNPAHYVIEHSMEYAERFAPEYKGREEEEPLRKVFFDTLKEMGKVNEGK